MSKTLCLCNRVHWLEWDYVALCEVSIRPDTFQTLNSLGWEFSLRMIC